MKVKMFAGLIGVLLLVMLSGCGGGNSTTSVAPSLTQSANQSQSSYFDGLQKMVNGLSSSSSVVPLQGKAKLETFTFTDTFSDATFVDGWFSNIEGNYTIAQQSGVLQITGDATQNQCDTMSCGGRGVLVAIASANAGNPINASTSITFAGNAPGNNIAQGLVGLFDSVGNLFVYGLFKSPAFCTGGNCLIFFHPGLGSPQVLLQNSGDSGTLSISYSNGNYALKFNSSTFNVSGPTLTGGVRFLLLGGTQNDISSDPSQVTVNATFDNATYSGTKFSDCNVTISTQILQNVIQVVGSVTQEMVDNGISQGFTGQTVAAVKTNLTSVLEDLQNSQQFHASDIRIGSSIHILDEVIRTLQTPRGSNVSPSLKQEWIDELSASKGVLQTIVTDAQVCS